MCVNESIYNEHLQHAWFHELMSAIEFMRLVCSQPDMKKYTLDKKLANIRGAWLYYTFRDNEDKRVNEHDNNN